MLASSTQVDHVGKMAYRFQVLGRRCESAAHGIQGQVSGPCRLPGSHLFLPDFRLAINYLRDCQALQLMLLFDPKVPDTRQAEVLRLLAQANSRNWLGHFDWWKEERAVMFRYGLPLRGASLAARQCEDVIDLALEACEMFFPALQYVLWSGLGAEEAIRLCQMQTVGEA